MEIRIAAAVLMRDDGATLLVRKQGTTAFMQPGGKIDEGESPLAALCRELSEELDLTIQPQETEYLGCLSAPAANEEGFTVIAEIFRTVVSGSIEAQAEIAEIRWIYPSDQTNMELAPLTRDHVLPLLGGEGRNRVSRAKAR